MKQILSFDLELNQDQTTGAKIIEVGACVGDIITGEILDTYCSFVNPNQKLTQEIIDLTSITQEQVDSGVTVDEAYMGMEKFAKKYKCLTLPIVWGGGDGFALRREMSNQIKWKFGKRELDVKAIFQSYMIVNNKSVFAGLDKAMKRLNLTFSGTTHRAVDDAINTFHIFHKLINNFKIIGKN